MFWLLLISIAFVILIVVFTSVPWAERKALFFPSKKCIWKPTSEYSNVYINIKTSETFNEPKKCMRKCKEEYINAWHFNNFPKNKTVMFCHGNSGNISHRQYIVDICEKFKLNLLIFDYRGFGKSSSEPSKRYLRADGEAAYKYLTNHCKIKSKKIIIWGESLGGIAATWTASKFPCHSLVLLCTFSGLDDAITYSFDKGVKQSLASGYSSLAAMRYDIMPNRRYISKVQCPVAIMHSKSDDVIPYECARILYKNVPYEKLLITIKGTHSSPIITREQLETLFTFCKIPLVCDGDEIDKMLKELETVAEKHHNFID